MVITKIFNNNCVLAEDGFNEIVVTGSGVGFQKKPGDALDLSRVEKKFELVDEYLENFELLVKRIPFDYFMITQAIIDKASEESNIELNSKIMVSLTDHISFAVERSDKDVVLPTLFEREMQMFYPDEYRIGLWAIDYIDNKLNVKLKSEEASFIALHILNSSSSFSEVHSARKVLEFTKKCIEIIEETLNITIDKKSIAFQRIITHLKFLGKHIIEKKERNIPSNVADIASSILLRFSSTVEAVDQIKEYVKETYDFDLNEDEYLYLSIHIYQVVNKSHAL